jgi:hypothetical protein
MILKRQTAAISVALSILFTANCAIASETLKSFWAGWQREVKDRGVAPEVFGRQFAQRADPQLLSEMVRDLRGDKTDDRFFSYVLVMVNWDPNQSRPILKKQLLSSNKTDRVWAKEFLAELESFQEAKREGKPFQ